MFLPFPGLFCNISGFFYTLQSGIAFGLQNNFWLVDGIYVSPKCDSLLSLALELRIAYSEPG